MREEVTFDRDKNPDEPFLHHLWAARGCTTTTVKVLMEYYKALSYQTQRRVTQLENAVKNSATNANADMSLQQEIEFMSEITKELTRKKLFDFDTLIEDKYSHKFKEKYSQFSPMKDYVLTTEMTMQLYDLFRSGFPHTHCVFFEIVSSSKHCIILANQFAEIEGIDDKVELDADLDSDDEY